MYEWGELDQRKITFKLSKLLWTVWTFFVFKYMNLILSRTCWPIFAKCLSLPEAENSLVITYLIYFTGINWSMRTVTMQLKVLSLYGFNNSCMKSMFFLSTPLFVLTEISSSPCRNARAHSLKASQLCKLTFAKTLISTVQLNLNSTETQWSGNPL